MKVKIADIKTRMSQVLADKGYTKDDIEFLIEMYLGGELRGHTSHGLAAFPGFIKQDFSNLPKPKVIKSTNSLFMTDAKSNPGAVVGKQAADEAIKRAKKEIVGTAIIKNMDGWLRPGAIAEYIADKGFLALVTNDGGGTSIAPPGGFDPTVGTNPIAYAFPTDDISLVVDMATSKRAWGQVRLAKKFNRNLPADTFYNDKGEVTHEPDAAYSVKSFGDYKGFALALFVEILCGSLIGKEMMRRSNVGSSFQAKYFPRGAFIMVIDPAQTYNLAKFKQETTEGINKIKSTQSLKGQQIRIPGEEAGKLRAQRLRAGFVEVPHEVWEEIRGL